MQGAPPPLRPAATLKVGTFDAVAFVLGFADKAFRSLIAKLTQLLFAPGDTGSQAADDPHHPE